jgi:ArsR family transcriptional regulator
VDVAAGDDCERLARVFKALGDETRLRLITALARRGEVTCGEFAAMCACSNSALTYHQRILSEAGLIAVRRAGQFRVLTLRRETMDVLLPGFLDHLACGGDVASPASPDELEPATAALPSMPDVLGGAMARGG